jgi:siroheme synthase-like protein
MGYLPLFTNVTDQPCIVIGGGDVAADRVRVLLDAGAVVTVIASAVTELLAELAGIGRITWRARSFIAGDLRGFRLAFCTDPADREAQTVAAEARALGVPINVTDRPYLCSFIMPAIVRRGPLQIAVSTSGASPALAKLIRGELEEVIGPEYESLVTILASLRNHLRRREPAPAGRANLARMLATELRDALARHDNAAIDTILSRHLGLRMSDLGIDAANAVPLSARIGAANGSK